MGLKIGIVGLPNVGKSTLFNLLTSGNVAAENYPFCTIDPNKGTVEVPDERLSHLAQLLDSERFFPGIIEFVDIAGLVKGASKGEGLGNRFLSHIRETHALLEVVRCFQDQNVTHRKGSIDPVEDALVVEMELMLSDLETLEGLKEKATRKVRGKEKGANERLHLVEKMIDWIHQGIPLWQFPYKDGEKGLLEGVHFLSEKPIMYLANISEEALVDGGEGEMTGLREYAQKKGTPVIPLSLKLEEELSHLERGEREDFYQELGLEASGVEKVISGGFDLLHLITFFTGVGNEELRAWHIKEETQAYRAAGKVHTDMEKGFIKAEVINYLQLQGISSLQEARRRGLMRIEGRDYLVEEGDLCYFHFRV